MENNDVPKKFESYRNRFLFVLLLLTISNILLLVTDINWNAFVCREVIFIAFSLLIAKWKRIFKV
ncbi:MAG: hypothetical protein IKT84_05065 [Bacteroidales bacterium]|nr:hypothetical protein [Bacteroidales bacterium]